MRILSTILFLGLLVFGVYTFADAHEHGWWLPANVSTFGPDIDKLFYLILYMVGFFFLLTEAVLVYCVWTYSRKRDTKATFTHGNHKLEMVWTAIPALLLLFIAFSQMSTWATIKFKSHFPDVAPMAEVYASQFDWRMRYPGPDGVFGTMDDLENPFELVVPVDEPVLFNLKSRDVIHSFFVPQFRLKQDATPGMTIPVWFQADKVGSYDLICAELCGWGHYKMAGRVRVVTRAEYDKWLADLETNMLDNGTEG